MTDGPDATQARQEGMETAGLATTATADVVQGIDTGPVLDVVVVAPVCAPTLSV